MSLALDKRLEVTALHNHFLFDSPRLLFMHVYGTSDAAKLAEAIGAVMKAYRGESASKSEALPAGIIEVKNLEAILGAKAKTKKRESI